MPGWTNAREALILAPVLWGALLINDLLITPEAWLLMLPGSLSSVILALGLAAILRRLFDLSLGLALLWSAIAIVTTAAIQTGLDIAFLTILVPLVLPDGISIPGYAVPHAPEQFVMHFRIVLSWNLVVFGFYGTALALLNAQRQTLDAQMKALRYQLNPHFLFNTLNSIAGLIEEGANPRAGRMALSLSSFLHTTLSLDPTQDVTLADEFALQQKYLEIEHERFSDRMRLLIDMPDEVRGALLPSLILQPLVENAIKHGVARKPGIVSVEMRARREGTRLLIIIENDMPANRVHTAPGLSVGLRNVEERLRHRHRGSRCTFGPIAPDRYRATIELPFKSA